MHRSYPVEFEVIASLEPIGGVTLQSGLYYGEITFGFKFSGVYASRTLENVRILLPNKEAEKLGLSKADYIKGIDVTAHLLSGKINCNQYFVTRKRQLFPR